MNKREYKKVVMIFIIIAFLLSISSNVLAIGIAPGSKTLNFQLGFEQEFEYTIINNDHKEMKVALFVQGDLSEAVKLSTSELTFVAEESTKKISAKIALPNELEKKPGTYTAEIVALELPDIKSSPGQQTIGAFAAVISRINIVVPIPGKYAEATLDITDSPQKKSKVFVIKMDNKGQQNINRIKAIVDIFGPTNEKITTLETQERALARGERKELVTSWNTENVKPGPYFAVITAFYDGEPIKLEKQFEFGELKIEILDVNVKNFKLGGVAKFNIVVENNWGTEIENIYAEMEILENGDFIANSESASIDISSLSKATLNTFWDTEGVKEGVYDTKITLFYEDQKEERLFKSTVTLNDIKITPVGITGGAIGVKTESPLKINSAIMMLVIILITLNLAWFLFFRKIIKNKNK